MATFSIILFYITIYFATSEKLPVLPDEFPLEPPLRDLRKISDQE